MLRCVLAGERLVYPINVLWVGWGCVGGLSAPSLPPIVLDHVGQLNDVFTFLVLLAGLKGMLLQPK